LRELDTAQRLGLGIALSTIPAAIVGASMPDAFTESLRTPVLIAVNLIVFGVLLGLADRLGSGRRGEGAITLRDALTIGAAQALALIPGTSRSGITMTAGLALGLDRATAARYSFLMSVPITALAVGHGGLQLVQSAERLDLGVLALGMAVSGLAGIVVIHVFLRILRQVGTLPFVAYRIALGLLVLGLVALRS
jgi:undecaprenyl-diphosphatase